MSTSNEYADLAAARTALSDLGDGYYLTSGVTLPYRVIPKPDYMRDTEPAKATWQDIYSLDELCAVLEVHSARMQKRDDGGYLDVNYAVEALGDFESKVNQASECVEALLVLIEDMQGELEARGCRIDVYSRFRLSNDLRKLVAKVTR